jgi:hypothetical protein
MTANNQVWLPFWHLEWNKALNSLIELRVSSDVIEVKCLLQSDELLPFGKSAALLLAIYQAQPMAAPSYSPIRIMSARGSTLIFVLTYHSIIDFPTLGVPYLHLKIRHYITLHSSNGALSYDIKFL